MVSISGGSDSDILLDMCEQIGYTPGTVQYVFFDTGMEFDATKRQLDYLEQKYGVSIHREKAVVPVPLGVKQYGVPFLSKKISNNIHRLQLHRFGWEDKPLDELCKEYPNCRSALRWWCNDWGTHSRLNISNRKWLKEFLIANPPDIAISSECCEGAKKRTAHALEKQYAPDLDVQGVRKAEGGIRSTAYSSCFDDVPFGADKFRPIFWFKQADKTAYERTFGIIHSDCYTQYGLRRTGCACCPFGAKYELELEAAKLYEPKLYKAACSIFEKSYEYTRRYEEFQRRKEETP